MNTYPEFRLPKLLRMMDHYVLYSPTKGFQLRSGHRSNLYVDVKSALLHPTLGGLIINAMYCEARRHGVVQDITVYGYGYGGAILASTIGCVFGLPAVIGRAAKREYGTESTLIGKVITKEVLLVEDVLTTGSSIREAIELLKNSAKIVYVIAVVDRSVTGNVEVKKLAESIDAPISCLLTERDLREYKLSQIEP